MTKDPSALKPTFSSAPPFNECPGLHVILRSAPKICCPIRPKAWHSGNIPWIPLPRFRVDTYTLLIVLVCPATELWLLRMPTYLRKSFCFSTEYGFQYVCLVLTLGMPSDI